MRAGGILDRILDEFEPRQTDAVEGLMIRAARVREREGFRAEVLEWLQPTAEERSRRLVALQIDAADFARAVVEVEVGGKFLILRLAHEEPAWTRVGGGSLGARAAAAFVGLGAREHSIGEIGVITEVLRYIRPRTEQALLLARPQ